MNTEQQARDVAAKTLGATTATTLALMLCGARENGDAFAPLNAVSHIVWGERAKKQRGFSARWTLTGIALSGFALASWALSHRAGMLLWQKCDGGNAASTRTRQSRAAALGAAVSALAYVIDFKIVPPRLRPGFETQISPRGLLFVYLMLAISLAACGENRES